MKCRTCTLSTLFLLSAIVTICLAIFYFGQVLNDRNRMTEATCFIINMEVVETQCRSTLTQWTGYSKRMFMNVLPGNVRSEILEPPPESCASFEEAQRSPYWSYQPQESYPCYIEGRNPKTVVFELQALTLPILAVVVSGGASCFFLLCLVVLWTLKQWRIPRQPEKLAPVLEFDTPEALPHSYVSASKSARGSQNRTLLNPVAGEFGRGSRQQDRPKSARAILDIDDVDLHTIHSLGSRAKSAKPSLDVDDINLPKIPSLNSRSFSRIRALSMQESANPDGARGSLSEGEESASVRGASFAGESALEPREALFLPRQPSMGSVLPKEPSAAISDTGTACEIAGSPPDIVSPRQAAYLVPDSPVAVTRPSLLRSTSSVLDRILHSPRSILSPRTPRTPALRGPRVFNIEVQPAEPDEEEVYPEPEPPDCRV